MAGFNPHRSDGVLSYRAVDRIQVCSEYCAHLAPDEEEDSDGGEADDPGRQRHHCLTEAKGQACT